jgi:hypothetical protein
MGFNIFRLFRVSKFKDKGAVLVYRRNVFGHVYLYEEHRTFPINCRLNFTSISKISIIKKRGIFGITNNISLVCLLVTKNSKSVSYSSSKPNPNQLVLIVK